MKTSCSRKRRLPGPSVAITSMHMTKLERFDEIGKRGKRNFENEFLEMFCQILQEIIIFVTKLESRIFRETTLKSRQVNIQMKETSKRERGGEREK